MKKFINFLLGLHEYDLLEYMDTMVYLEQQKGKIELNSNHKIRVDVLDYEDNTGLCVSDNIDKSNKFYNPDYFSRIVLNVYERGLIDPISLISFKMGKNKCKVISTHFKKKDKIFLLNESLTFRDLNVALVFFVKKANALAKAMK